MDYVDVGIYDTGFDPYYDDAGWFGSKLVKSVGKRVGKIGKGIGKAAVGVAKGVAPIAGQALPYIQQGMKAMGPVGMIASGAAGALSAVVQGKSLENIAWAAAEGASPPGIDRAVAAAKALREGKPVLQVAITQARQSFAPGSAGQRAFDLGVSAVKGGSKEMLANARNQLRSATEKAAFDSAVGSISKAAGHLTNSGQGPRISFVQARPRQAMSLLRPTTQAAVNILRRRPMALRMQDRDIASRFNLPLRRVIEARGIVEASGVVEVGAPSEALGTYIVKSGDTGSGLAKRFTGDANRWRELPKYNKRGMGGYTGGKDMVVKQTTTTIKGKKVPVTLLDPFYSGLKINVPPGWAGPGISPGVEVIPEVVITPGPAPQLPPQVPVGLPPPVVTSPPVSIPPVTTPPITTPPISMPEPLPPIPGQTIPPVTTPPIDIPPATVPVGLPPATTTPPPVTAPPTTIPVPTVPVPTTPATTEEKKKKDATALAFGVAAAAALMYL
jgi:nucleoid-associated protein YgaU